MRRLLPQSKTGAAFWTCSEIDELQGQTRLFAGKSGQLGEKFALAFGVHPTLSVKAVMEAPRAGGHPDFLKRLLQVHDDLAAVGKGERDHAAHALVVDVGIGGVVDAVTRALDGTQGGFSLVQVFVVGHYNAIMIYTRRILGALSSPSRSLLLASLMCVGLFLAGCGQKGPLYLPTNAGVKAKPANSPTSQPDIGSEVKDQPSR